MTPPVSVAVALLSAWVGMMFWATTTDNTPDSQSTEWIDPGNDRAASRSETRDSETTFHTADD